MNNTVHFTERGLFKMKKIIIKNIFINEIIFMKAIKSEI